MSSKVRLEPAAVAPGAVEQMMVRLDTANTIVGVQLDEPEHFEVIRIIAGRSHAVPPFEDVALPISPPNAFVIVLVKSKTNDGETRICSGDLLVSGEVPASVAPPVPPPAPTTPAVVPTRAAPAASGKITFDTDERGWPKGGSNEVWVLMGRGEAERLVQAINGYPISAGERPALLRRFGQALGTVR